MEFVIGVGAVLVLGAVYLLLDRLGRVRGTCGGCSGAAESEGCAACPPTPDGAAENEASRAKGAAGPLERTGSRGPVGPYRSS